MGNCLMGGGMGEGEEGGIKVVTSNGGIMELVGPIRAGTITSEFPGHGIFRTHDLFWKPLRDQQELLAGESYYLLPLGKEEADGIEIEIGGHRVRQGHVRSTSIPGGASLQGAPYRMSLDSHSHQGMMLLRRSYTEPFSFSSTNSRPSANHHLHHGPSFPFWKVKLVITPEHLLQILSQEGPTQELIESVRTVAKCGNSAALSASLAFSDHWTLSASTCSSRVTSSNPESLL